MNTELQKNAECYTDPTAAATLTQKETGDIWEYKDGECLILKGHRGFATILRLHDSDQYGDRIKVADRPDGSRYVDPTFIISGSYRDMGRYVETLDDVTLENVVYSVETALGVNLQTVKNPVAVELREKLDIAEALIEEQREQLERYRDRIQVLAMQGRATAEAMAEARADATKVRNQLELLRYMYNELLAKIVKE